jgi:polyphosphate glucokinase
VAKPKPAGKPKAVKPASKSVAKNKPTAKPASKPASKTKPANTNAALGIDVGGTGIKAALVDVTTGVLLTKRHRVNTPRPSTPEAIAATVKHLVGLVEQEGKLPADTPVGVGLPGPIKDGVLMTAANIDRKWVGTNAEALFGKALGNRVYAINDADAAGLAEIRVGAGRGRQGTVLMLTIGTGIGSGLFVDGKLVPDTEMGHLEFKGRDAETRLSGVARERRNLRWRAWATEFSQFLARVELYFWPDLIILGGGVSKELAKYGKWLKSRAPIVPAQYLNTSGIIGAAMYAADRARGVDPA